MAGVAVRVRLRAVEAAVAGHGRDKASVLGGSLRINVQQA